MIFLRQLREDSEVKAMQKLESMIENDYSGSTLSADEYKNATKDYDKYAEQLLVSWFGGVPEMNVSVDMEKRGRLLRILQMAIKIGLNYQMLSPIAYTYRPTRRAKPPTV